MNKDFSSDDPHDLRAVFSSHQLLVHESRRGSNLEQFTNIKFPNRKSNYLPNSVIKKAQFESLSNSKCDQRKSRVQEQDRTSSKTLQILSKQLENKNSHFNSIHETFVFPDGKLTDKMDKDMSKRLIELRNSLRTSKNSGVCKDPFGICKASIKETDVLMVTSKSLEDQLKELDRGLMLRQG